MKTSRAHFGLRTRCLPALTGMLPFLLLGLSPLTAQETGAIRGVVLSSITGEPLSGVRVLLEEVEMEAVTGEDGGFSLVGVPAGPIRIPLNMIPTM
jgi:hypothetical protein